MIYIYMYIHFFLNVADEDIEDLVCSAFLTIITSSSQVF